MIHKALKRILAGVGGQTTTAAPRNKSQPPRKDVENVIRSVDRALVDQQARSLLPLRSVEIARSPRLIVSLTSYPARIEDAFYAIVSLLRQSMKPDALILWLTAHQFPRGEADIPERILALREMGLRVAWCDKDIRSYTKLVPALLTYKNDIVVTADDDIYYTERWLERLYHSYLSDPGSIHAHRVHRCHLDASGQPLPYAAWDKAITTPDASLLNFATGCGGVLYPPRSLYPDVTQVDIFTALCPTADDVWFWCMAVRQGTPIRVVENGFPSLVYVNAERELGLYPGTTLYELNRTANDIQIAKAFSLFDDKTKRLLSQICEKKDSSTFLLKPNVLSQPINHAMTRQIVPMPAPKTHILRETAFAAMRLLSRPFPGSWRLARPRAAVVRVLRQFVALTIPSRPVVCTTNHGFRLVVQPGIDKGVERSIYLLGTYEEGTLWVVSRLLRSGDVFVDIGANIGLMSIHAAQLVGREGAVYSFEPMPDVFAQLQANIALNATNHVVAVPLALGSAAAELPIFAHPEINRGSSSLIAEDRQPSHVINVSTLEEYADVFIRRPIRLIKIDVEGWELEVLRGMNGILAGDDKPILCVECSQLHGLQGGTLADLYRLVHDTNGYRCFTLKRGKEHPSPFVEVASVDQLPRHDNLFCFPEGFELPHELCVQ